MIADNAGGPEHVTTGQVLDILDRAKLGAGRSTVSKALNELRRDAGFAGTEEAPEAINVSEPVTAPEESEQTTTPPEPVEAPTAAVAAPVAEAKPKPSRRWLSIFAAAVVAIVAAVASFSHMQEVALMAGQSEVISYLLPLSVDGLIVVGSVALVDGATRKGIAWFSFAFGVVASLAANVLSAEPNILSRSVAAWPAVALLLTVEVLLQRRKA
ncbi:DUF2637 domain-containing protein [Glycomyces sp. NPDC046736]|uniref:DUF2637 domain-containing protein n=1 Tax=Glycomyces sp. NPDC046736 TaxID=3155615 RepID=UPI0034033580